MNAGASYSHEELVLERRNAGRSANFHQTGNTKPSTTGSVFLNYRKSTVKTVGVKLLGKEMIILYKSEAIHG